MRVRVLLLRVCMFGSNGIAVTSANGSRVFGRLPVHRLQVVVWIPVVLHENLEVGWSHAVYSVFTDTVSQTIISPESN